MSNADQTRIEIERAALNLFLERGYAGTPLRLIAQAANLTTPSLYWHYRSKDDLCYTIVAGEYDEFGDLVQAAVGSGTPDEQLREYVEAFVSLQLLRRTGPMKLGFDQLVASLPETQRAKIAQGQRPLLDVLRNILRSGQSLGVFAVVDVTLTAFAIISVSNYVFTWYRPGGPLAVDEIARNYADLAIRLAGGVERDPTVQRWAAVAPDPASSVRAESGEATYERILTAATSLFIEQGYEGTPVSRIAKTAGVTTAALYRYFGSKEELYFTVVKRGYVRFLNELLAGTIGDSSAQRLHSFVRAFVRMQLRDPEISMKYGYQQLRDALPEQRRAELDSVEAAWIDHLKQILVDGRSEGALSFTDLDLTTLALINLCEYVFTWFKPDGRLSAAEVADMYAELARRAVGA